MLLDLERDATQPILPIPPPDEAEAEAGAGAEGQPVVGEARGPLAGPRQALVHNLRRQVGVARRTAEAVGGLARAPASIPATTAEAMATVRSLTRQLSADPARSPLWTQRSLSRHLETVRIPLDDARRAVKALGGTVNDLFVSGAAAAAGEYHRRAGQPTPELRLSMPVSTREKGQTGGNAFAPTRTLVPTGEMSASERFAAVHELLSTAKTERAIGLTQSLAGVVNLLPTSMVVSTARRVVDTIDFAVSNVRGAPFDLYLAGAKVEANYPIGPTGGTAFNLTTLSSGGMLDLGLNCDRAAVADPELLRTCLELAYDELLTAGSEAS